MTNSYNILHRIDKAQDIGNMRDADKLRTRRQQRGQRLHAEMTAVVHRKHLQDGTFPLAQHLPGYDIGMVLRFADNDFVFFADKRFAKTEGHQVDSGRGAGGKDDFLTRFRIQIGPDGVAGRLILLRSQIGKAVHCAMQVGVALHGQFFP